MEVFLIIAIIFTLFCYIFIRVTENKSKNKQNNKQNFVGIYDGSTYNGNINDLALDKKHPFCYYSNDKFFIKNQNQFEEITFDSDFNFKKFKNYSIYTISVTSLSATYDNYYKIFKVLLPIDKDYKDKNLTKKFKTFCEKNIGVKKYLKKIN